MKKVVGFGDFIVRLSPPGYERFIQASSFNINYTGAEANVLVSLAQMGVPTEFVTRLPNNAIAKAALSMLNKYGVHTDKVAFGGERMGLFYCEKGASQRPSKIVYDRKFTSICEAKYEDFDWDAIFEGASNFHITGITPALSPNMAEVCLKACEEAEKRGIIVSCDLNYRKFMWTPEQAKATMEKIVPKVHTLIANEEDAEKVLGIKARNEKGGILGRCCTDLASPIDIEEAVKLGALAARTVLSGQGGMMPGLKRISDEPYQCEEILIPVEDVMMNERLFPKEYIAENGIDVTEDFIRWCKPLVGEIPEYAYFR